MRSSGLSLLPWLVTLLFAGCGVDPEAGIDPGVGTDAAQPDGPSADGGGTTDGSGTTDGGGTSDSGGGSEGWLSGASGAAARDGTFAAWRGTPVGIGGTWCDSDLEEQVECPGAKWGWSEFDGPLDVAIGAIAEDEGETWAKAGDGAYDERWIATLNNLRSYRQGKGTTYIRLAHEFNGDWWPGSWQVEPEEVDDFIAGWRRFRALQLSIYPASRLVWCPNDATTMEGLDVRDAWPGDDHVDVIGVDSYNWSPHVTSQAAFDVKVLEYDEGMPLGLETWRLFAEEHGKPLAIPEWGSPAVDDGHGGSGAGDSPGFYEAFHGWLDANAGSGPGQILYEVLFNTDPFQLYPDTDQPNAAEKYRDLW